jgi:hypothetical protein
VDILAWIASNWDNILLIAALIIALIVLYKKGEIKILKAILFALVTEAERQLGGGTGELKKSTVIDWIYDRMPSLLRLVFSRKEIESIIEEVLEYAKKKWATNPNLAIGTAQETTQ